MTDDPARGEHSGEDDPRPDVGGERDEQLTGDGDDTADGGILDDTGQLPVPLRPSFDLSGIINLGEFAKAIGSLLPDASKIMEASGIKPFREALAGANLVRRIYPALNLTGLAPHLDTASLIPKLNLDIARHIPKFDFTSLLPKLNIGPAMRALLEQIRERLPPNWPTDLDEDRACAIIQEEGIPLVWVPRSNIVTELVDAADWASRVAILLAHQDELVEDCRTVLGDIHHKTLLRQLPLAERAVDAFAGGHGEAVQALAVVLTESIVSWAIEVDSSDVKKEGSRYKAIRKEVLFDPDLVPLFVLRLRAALAPIGTFYTAWYASSGTPPPEKLSRHVTVHQADPGHYTAGNAVVAVLLLVSVMRAVQELQELAEATAQDTNK